MAKLAAIEDQVFGKLQPEEELGWYEGQVKWNGEPILIHLRIAAEPDQFKPVLAAAHQLWREQKHWHSQVVDYAVSKLLPLKNRNWLEEDEKELTPEQFRKAMRLESISIGPKGKFTFWFDDGELFWGHIIQICGDLDKGPTDADIPG